ncbi:unnamed protein product, partial [Ectocarpus sp. 4 AP-2014]
MVTLEASPDMSFGDAGDRWERAAIKRCLAGSSGVSGVMGLVGSQHVLWSKACGGLASRYYSSGAVARCGGCRECFRERVLKRLAQAAKPVPRPCTSNKDMTSAQKVCSLVACYCWPSVNQGLSGALYSWHTRVIHCAFHLSLTLSMFACLCVCPPPCIGGCSLPFMRLAEDITALRA